MAIVGPEDLDTAEARARAGLLAVELALRTGDPTPARRFVTETFHDTIQADLKEAVLNGWRRVAEDLSRVTARATAPGEDAALQVTTVILTGEGQRGWLDKNGRVVDPLPKGQWSEAWSMVRSADVELIAAARVERCQDCGAPLPEVDDGRCPFCREVLRPQPGEWAARGRGRTVSVAPGATQVQVGESTTRSGDTVTHVSRRVVIKGLPPGMDPNNLPPDIQGAIDAAVAGGQPGTTNTTTVVGAMTATSSAMPAAPPPLPQDPADLALATTVVLPLAAFIDTARAAGDLTPGRPYMAPGLFEVERTRVGSAAAGPAPGARHVLAARHTPDGARELLSARISQPGGGEPAEDWVLERWREWGPGAGWLIASIQR